MSNMAPIVPKEELLRRMHAFRARMDLKCPDWKLALFVGKINLFYFTGTMQEGVLLIPRDDEAVFWVRRSYERAVDESLFPDIRPMESYRDIMAPAGGFPNVVYLETELMPVAMLQRLKRYFPFSDVKPLDAQIAYVRSVKSVYELDRMKQSGLRHARVLEERLPKALREGMSEVDLCAQIFSMMLQEGYQGITRFAMFDTEIVLGQMGFGENSIYPAYFNGPGGSLGMSPATPILGSRERKLKAGDLVFADIGFGYEGYHTDKTMTYVYKGELPNEAVNMHNRCLAIQDEIASMLKPGNIPSEIYRSVMGKLDAAFLLNFMGYKNRKVKFLGHGIGLVIDEYPVIAEGFEEPLEEGMTIALEPKYGVSGVGMVGIENTFLVTKEGGVCITGENRGLMRVD